MEKLEETERTRQEPCQVWNQTILGKNLREQQERVLGKRRGYNAPRGNKRNATQGRVPVPYGLLCQIALNNEEPPYAERHVRWCERSENE
ncbi:MAG: hypothetical protein MJZ25_16560, partial [Fibrobacter sp.]|nr:hypothetical protein [Fibrobacter sp.]